MAARVGVGMTENEQMWAKKAQGYADRLTEAEAEIQALRDEQRQEPATLAEVFAALRKLLPPGVSAADHAAGIEVMRSSE